MKIMKTKKKTPKERSEGYPLCAIDIGSSSIRAMVASTNSDGTFHIKGLETMPTKPNTVERGLIVHTTEMSSMIKRILMLLANRANLSDSIDRVFVSVGGRLLQFVTTNTKRCINRNYVTDKMLESMRTECTTKIENKYSTMAVLSADPRCYILDGEMQEERPNKNQRPNFLEVAYNVFVGRMENKEKLKGSFDRANVSIEQHWVRPDALLTALADKRDMEKGCAIIDFGAQTTMLSIYKGNEFLYTNVIALGGDDINQELEKLGINRQYVEEIKQEYGYAAKELIEKNITLAVRKPGPTKETVRVKLSDIADVIQKKLFEMLSQLMADLEDYEDEISVVYITGGGCKLNGLINYVQSMTEIEVEYGSHAAWLELDAPDEYYEPENTNLIGTLALGAEHRRNHPDKEPVSTPPWGKRISETMMSLFSDEEK